MGKKHVGGAQGCLGTSSGPAGLVFFAGHLRLEAPEKGLDSDQGASRGGSLLGSGSTIRAARLWPQAVSLGRPEPSFQKP